MQHDQTVFEMVEEILKRQARALADQTGNRSRERWRSSPIPKPADS
ncbi:MAG: hypothetical protein M3317_02480 [Actinomycetota bacterium]|nr:hypothetical protein [Actinomycetota bacterium]